MRTRPPLARFLPIALVLAACGAPAPGPDAAQAGPAKAQPASLDVLDPAYREKLEPLAVALNAKLDELHLPGFALAIVADDHPIFARGFGLADVEQHRPVTPETLFAIGSTTKAFTSTLVAMLVDEQKLAFDDPITKTLPWFTLQIAGGEPVTFRDLMSHRTGFARMDMLWYGSGVDADEILRTATQAEPLVPFRKEFQYNNIMFLAAGRACEQVTGKSWQELVRARLFAPLGMKDSDTSVAAAQADARLALGYRWDEDEKRFVHVPMRALESIAPAGAINSNVLDLTRWIRFQLGRGELEGKRLVSQATLDETWKPHNQVASDVRYGLGWFLHTWNGRPYVEHGGNIDGFAAEIALLPEQKIGVAMLTNVGASALQGQIGPMVFEALLGAPKNEDAGAAPQEDLTRYTGTFLANFFAFHDAKFEVSVRNGKLAVDVPGQQVFELLPPDKDGKRAFALVPDQIQVEFLEEDGRVVALRLHQGGLKLDAPRPGWEPKPEIDLAELERYLGSYSDPVNKKTFTVVIAHNRLAVDYPGQMVYELLPPDKDERWVFRATDRMALEFHLDADDHAESVTFYEQGVKRECELVGGGGITPPTLEELMALRKADAFEARLAELGSCRLTGSMRFVHAGIRGPMTTTFDASGSYVEVVDLRPYLWTETAFDGEHAHSRSSSAEEKELRGASLDQTRANGAAALFGDWRRRFDKVEIVRVDEEREERTVRVKLTAGSAPAFVAHVDLASGDLVRAEVGELVDEDTTIARSFTFEGWRDFDGLRLPARMISEDPAVGRIVFEYDGMESHLAPAPFTLPAALPKR